MGKSISELESKIARLMSELERTKEHERNMEESRQSLLYMLEDLNEATAVIKRAKKEWEATFDNISDPLFIHDKEFKIVRANQAYQKMAGMKFKEFIGKPYYEVFPKMERPFKMCLKASELQEEEEEEEEFSCPVTNRIFNVRFYPIKDIDNKLLHSIHIMEDTTEKKRAEKKLKDEIEITTHLLMIADATAHTTDMDKLMQQVVHCGQKIMGCNICLSYIWDNKTKLFQPEHTYGLSHEMISFFKTEPLDEKTKFVKKAMEGKEPVITSQHPPLNPLPSREGRQTVPSPFEGEGQSLPPKSLSGGEGGAFSWLPDINTLAAIPLVGKEDYLGLIIGVYLGTDLKSVPTFTERDKKIMQGISHQVSLSLEQARLYRESVDRAMELSHKIETIQVMHEIDRSILSTLESEEILGTVARMVVRIIPCDRVTIASVDNEKGGFRWKAGFGTTFLPKAGFVVFKDTSATEIIKTKRIEYVANLMNIKDLLPIERGLMKEGFLSHIRAPITVKGEVAGIVTIGAKRPAAFTPENLSTLEKIAGQIGVALENARLLTDLNELFMGTVRSLSTAIDAKSKWTAGHSERVTAHAVKIAKGMGMNGKALKDIELAGFLHDIGKIGTYEAILDKPGKLTDEELALMRQHPAKGADILAPIRQLTDILPGVKYHHEFYDGTGYPEGLKEEAIPLMARILGVADAVDAMGADRPYRKGRAMDVIIAELKRCSGTQFDPKVVEVFLDIHAMGDRQ